MYWLKCMQRRSRVTAHVRYGARQLDAGREIIIMWPNIVFGQTSDVSILSSLHTTIHSSSKTSGWEAISTYPNAWVREGSFKLV